MLSIKNLVKIYKPKKAAPVMALDHLSIDFPDKGLVFLLGKSGSGKSTLLNTIGGLDKFDDGEIIIKGKSSKEFSTTDFDSYRNTFIGFIFQEYNILEEFTVSKNLALAVELQGKKPSKDEVNNLLTQVDMLQFAKRKPNQLSGGQKQRIAIARALIKNPEIIMADEPTGALDSATGKQVMETLKQLSKNKLVIIVSHDREFAEEYGDRIIELKDGKIIRDVTKKEVPAAQDSGLKIIDDNLIVIPKGQAITSENLNVIVNSIKKKVGQDDVIISLDKNTNDKMKSAASINSNGNKESFITTEQQDIQRTNYNKHDLKLIKSRFKNADAFKMGASSLKYKKGKLFFTILLSLVTFVMFGVVDTFSCFNVAQSSTDTLAMVKPDVVAVSKAHYGKYQTNLDDEDLAELKKQAGQNFYPVKAVNYGYNWRINDVYLNNRNTMFNPSVAGVMTLNDKIANDLGVRKLAGSYPQAANEVVITKHFFDCYDRALKSNSNSNGNSNGNNVSSDYQSVISTEEHDVTFSFDSYGSGSYKIVGIVDDGIDFSKYDKEDSKVSTAYDEADKLNKFGFSNLVFLSEEGFDMIPQSNNNSTYFYLKGDQLDAEYCSVSSNFTEIESMITYKQGYNANTVLDANQVMISLSTLNKISNNTPKEFLSNDGIIKIQSYSYNSYGSYEYESKEYEVVAVYMLSSDYNYNNDKIYFSDSVNLDSTSCDFYAGETTYYASAIKIHTLGEDVTYKPGFTGKLKNNQIIISSYQLENSFKYDGTVNEYLSGDTKVKFYYDYDCKDLYEEFEVVGVIQSDNYDSKIYVAPGSIKAGAYSFVVTKGGSSSVIKSLSANISTLKSDNYTYKFEDKSLVTIETFGGMVEMLTQPLLYVSLILAAFAALFLSNFISTSISYKKREIGILRAIGAKSWDVFKIFFFESFLITGITYVLGVIGTAIACTLINHGVVSGVGLDIVLLSFGIRQVLLMLGITVLISVVATFLPVRKIAKKNPVDAINNR